VKNPDLKNLLFDDFFRSAIHTSQVCLVNVKTYLTYWTIVVVAIVVVVVVVVVQ